MSLTITLNVFSGRPNPVWVIPDEASDEFDSRLGAITSISRLKPSGLLGSLGYRGFSVRKDNESHVTYVHGGVVDTGHESPALVADDRGLEKWLLSTSGSSISAEVRNHVLESLESPIDLDATLRGEVSTSTCHPCAAADAPVYNPGMWNTPAVQPRNNCYNYANNQITGTFAQPGRASGHPITNLANCSSPSAAATSDGLHAVPSFSAALGSGGGWYVALVVWPGNDFHWYRQDKVGCWSHKPGSTPVRNVDNASRPISDPMTANRGPYTLFCSFMVTKAGIHIR
jgi:hypothetical protein